MSKREIIYIEIILEVKKCSDEIEFARSQAELNSAKETETRNKNAFSRMNIK